MAWIPYEQREVVNLYMQGDLTFRQIARIQNASINTVQGRYRYGIANSVTLKGVTVHPLGAQPDRWAIGSLGD